MPSILIELGFLTNNKEGKYLNSKKGQDEMAKSIISSIVDYKESLDAIYYVPDVPEPEVPEVVNNDSITEVVGQKIYDGITFKVQIAAGSNDIELEPKNFNGLDQLSKIQFEGLYKYYFGSTSNYNLIKELRDVAVDKGYASCFVVAFKDNELIPLTEALKTDATSN